MVQRSSRLVACLSLVVYVLSNTHLTLAFSVLASAPAPRVQPAESSPLAGPSCKHCAKRALTADQKKSNGRPTQHDGNCPGNPVCPSCPCCPGENHPCPVPGGCAMCSIAKAPCLTPLTLGDCNTSIVVPFYPERCLAYVPPFGDGMIRPPKA